MVGGDGGDGEQKQEGDSACFVDVDAHRAPSFVFTVAFYLLFERQVAQVA